MKNKIIIIITFVFLSITVLPGQFFNDEETVRPNIEYENVYKKGVIIFHFDLRENHHITDLRNDFFKIELPENDYLSINGITFPEGVEYGDEKVYMGKFDVFVYVKALKNISGNKVELDFNVSYQICQEKPLEVCYPPETDKIKVTVTDNFVMSVGNADSSSNVTPVDANEGFASWVEKTIKTELGKKSLLLFLMVFIGGFLTSFTPCVYPVIPIVMGYVGTRSKGSKLKGLYLSIFFVLGLAIVYSIFGIFAAMTGSMLGISFQNPVVVYIIAGIFIAMGLSMAGFFEIPVPSSISSKVQKGHKSEIIGSMIVGGVAGIIAAPCVGPVLVALLSWISQTGNIFLGFWLTFTFSLGLGIIFLLAGTFSGVISAMPKGGKWMDYFKYFFAVLLIGGGLYFLGTILSQPVNLMLWGLFLLSAPVFSGLFNSTEKIELKAKMFKVVLVVLFLIGAFLFTKGINMKYFPEEKGSVNVKTSVEKSVLNWESTLEAGKKIAKEQRKIIMIDTYADWCVACKELDEQTFSAPEVIEELKKIVLIKLDFTEKNEKNEQIRKSLNVIGMPTVIFLDSSGKEIDRFSGFIKKDKFLKFFRNKVLKKSGI